LQQRTNSATPAELDGPTMMTLLGYAVVAVALGVGVARSAVRRGSPGELLAS
jgi:hypothetical protein